MRSSIISEETDIRFDANDYTFEFVRCCCWYKYNAGHQTENFCVWFFFPHCSSSHFTNCCALLKLHDICHLHNRIPSARFTRFDPLSPSHPSTFPLRWRCCRDLTWSKKSVTHHPENLMLLRLPTVDASEIRVSLTTWVMAKICPISGVWTVNSRIITIFSWSLYTVDIGWYWYKISLSKKCISIYSSDENSWFMRWYVSWYKISMYVDTRNGMYS